MLHMTLRKKLQQGNEYGATISFSKKTNKIMANYLLASLWDKKQTNKKNNNPPLFFSVFKQLA